MAGPSLADVLHALASSSDEEDLKELLEQDLNDWAHDARNEVNNNFVTVSASGTTRIRTRSPAKCRCTSHSATFQGATTRSMSRRGKDCPFMNTRSKKKDS